MKLIHCADLHLDAKMQAHLDRGRARQRRDELLQNFGRLAAYARDQGVGAILIAGDLFDRDQVSALARNTVLAVMRAYSDIRFYYLRGNHDVGDCLGEDLPNLFRFGNQWRIYGEGEGGGVAIAGMELSGDRGRALQAGPGLDPDRFNIVLLHGQAGREIDLGALRGRGIDYLALGHIHARQEGRLDARGLWCYPGCLEGRGFDECGQHGFMLLEIDEARRAMSRRFVPFARRVLHDVQVDVAGCGTTAQMQDLVEDALRDAGCRPQDMASVTLAGNLGVDCEKDLEYLRAGLEARFFFARLRDRTAIHIDADDYLYDASLRGAFVRLVMGDDSLPEEEKAAIIRYGFLAMDGEEIE